MRRHGTTVVLAACVLIVLMMGMISLNCVQKLSHGCLFSHKIRLHNTPCPSDSVTSRSTTGVVALPASAPAVPEQVPVRFAEVTDFFRSTVNPSLEAPPLRC